MPRQQMKRIDVVKKGDRWVGETKSGERYSSGRTKTAAVQDTAKKARRDPQDVSVRIHGINGRIQQERTYPRSGDPRSSKG